MVVGIIGSGVIGLAIAHLLLSVGIQVIICNRRGPASLADAVEKLGPGAVAGTLQQVTKPEIIFLAVPWSSVHDVLEDLPDLEGRILIDATNPTEAPDHVEADLGGRTSSEIVAELAYGAHVVKAFNVLPAEILAAGPNLAGGRRVIFFSGDHVPAKAEVGRLIARTGFAGIDLGPLSTGSRLQQFPGGPLANLALVALG
nr:NADPH-dependent F420 reductase [Rhizobium mesoamericanum]